VGILMHITNIASCWHEQRDFLQI